MSANPKRRSREGCRAAISKGVTGRGKKPAHPRRGPRRQNRLDSQ